TIGGLDVEGEAPPAPGTTALIGYASVEPNYFSALGMRFVQGGTFVDTLAPSDVIVNEGFARKHWPNGPAVGRRLRVVDPGSAPGNWWRVVGVVRDAAAGIGGDPGEPMLYYRSVRHVGSQILVRVRPGTEPTAALRAIGQQAAPHKSPPDVAALSDVIKSSIAGPRFTMLLLTLFTGIAVVLAAIGLYGVLAYSVAQRTREIGIRVALGASRRRIARSIVSDGVRLAFVGVVIGGVGAMWATKLVASMLHGVERTDATSFLLGAFVLLATAVIACIVPVRRAVTVDPSIAMRSE
ncbi:MAG TPA: FtsX-like permease family protein, partial [Gemmatimonadaceae bacterium]